MGRVTFNQLVKHDGKTYEEGDSVTVTDEEETYFGANGWLEGVAAEKDAEQLIVPDTPSLGIVPENPYVNNEPLHIAQDGDVTLEVHNGSMGTTSTDLGGQ